MSLLLCNSLKNSYGTGTFVPVYGHGGMEADIQAFLTAALDGCEWSPSHLCRCTRGRSPWQSLNSSCLRTGVGLTDKWYVPARNETIILQSFNLQRSHYTD